MPITSSFSVNFGRMPVGLRRPMILPSCDARLLEREHVLHDDDVTLHALDLGDVGDLAGAVLEPVLVDDQVHRGRDLLADGPQRQLHAGHQHHRLEAGEHVAGGVGVARGHRAVVAGVHGLEHVQRLARTTLADDDPVGPHAQGVAAPARGWGWRPCPRCWRGATSSVTTCSWRSWSSAASSMVTIRSSLGMKDERMLSIVVLPEPVPPETMMFRRASTQALQEVDHLGRARCRTGSGRPR